MESANSSDSKEHDPEPESLSSGVQKEPKSDSNSDSKAGITAALIYIVLPQFAWLAATIGKRHGMDTEPVKSFSRVELEARGPPEAQDHESAAGRQSVLDSGGSSWLIGVN